MSLLLNKLISRLTNLIPNKTVRSITRSAGYAAKGAARYGIYEADRAASFAEAERTGERITCAEFPVLLATLVQATRFTGGPDSTSG